MPKCVVKCVAEKMIFISTHARKQVNKYIGQTICWVLEYTSYYSKKRNLPLHARCRESKHYILLNSNGNNLETVSRLKTVLRKYFQFLGFDLVSQDQ